MLGIVGVGHEEREVGIWLDLDHVGHDFEVEQIDLDRIADAFPGDRLIVFTHTVDLPPNLDPTRLEPIGVVAADVTQWGEAGATVPLFFNTFPLEMTAWSFDRN